MRIPAILVTCLLAGSAGSAGAALAPLFSSGQLGTDGLGIDTFMDARVSPSGRVAFLGTTSALVLEENGTASVVAKTSDPLPAPFRGTINSIRSFALSRSGLVVVTATLNSMAGGLGVFRREAGGLVAVAVESSVGAVAIDDDGDVAYVADGSIRVAPPTGSPSVVVRRETAVPGGGTFRTFGPIRVGRGPTLVFAARGRRRSEDGLFRWTPSSGIERLATEPNFRNRSRFALSATGYVAFTQRSHSTVSLFAPADGTTTVVAQPGVPVGDEVLTALRSTFVEVDDAGSVFFTGEVGGRNGRVLLRSSGGVVTVAQSGDLPSAQAGAILTRTSREALYRLDRGGAVPLAWVGAEVVDWGRVESIGTWTFDGHNLVVLAENSVGSVALLSAGREGLKKLVARGDTAPGGTVSLDVVGLALRRGQLVFDSGVAEGPRSIFTVDVRRGRVHGLVRAGDPGPGGTVLVEPWVVGWLGDRLLFAVSPDDRFDLLVRRPGGVSSIARTDGAAPGGGHFSQLRFVLLGERRLLFDASLRETADVFQTFVKKGKGLRRSTPPTGVTQAPTAFLGKRLLYVGVLPGEVDQSVFAVGRSGVEVIARSGQASPVGGTVSFFHTVAAAGRHVVIDADLADAGVATALLGE